MSVRYLTFVGLVFALAGGCASGSDGATVSDDDSESCDEVIGESCECDDGETSETVCSDGDVMCDCEPASGDGDDDDDDALPADDDGEDDDTDDDGADDDVAEDAAKPAPTKDGSTTKPDGSTRPADGGTGPSDSGTMPSADASTEPEEPLPPGMGAAPQIPEPMGECPEFKSGTISLMGTSGISLVAGAKKEGTGSVVFYWHGTGSSWGGESLGSFPRSVQNDITAKGGIIFAINGSKKTGGDCSGTGTFGKDDFKIADQVVACAVKNHGINPRRIYTTGCSAGGLMAGCMAFQRPQYLAAAVPNSGGVTIGSGSVMKSLPVPAVMTMYGPASSDMVIIAFENSSKQLMTAIKGAGGFAVGCNHGGGHCRAPAALYESGWKFMQDHPYGTKPSPYMMALPAGFHSSCKVF